MAGRGPEGPTADAAETAAGQPAVEELLPPEADAWEDQIVAEVHAIRARLWEEAGGTMEGLVALLQESERRRRAGEMGRGGEGA